LPFDLLAKIPLLATKQVDQRIRGFLGFLPLLGKTGRGKYKSLKDGQTVEFDIIEGKTGRPQAAMVVLVK
jgi:'Cold-shock' DNA-binding domain